MQSAMAHQVIISVVMLLPNSLAFKPSLNVCC
jgi:hypothetical protein